MSKQDGLLIHLRIMGKAIDIVEESDRFGVESGMLVLYQHRDGELELQSAYNLDIIEKFELIPADQIERVRAEIEERQNPQPAVPLKSKPDKDNPFTGGKLRFKDEGGRAA